MLAVSAFGGEVPGGLLLIAVVVLFFLYLLVNRGSPHRKGFGGRGRVTRCRRCGHDFQEQRVEYMDDGSEHVFHDDRCPNCGWDQDRGDPTGLI